MFFLSYFCISGYPEEAPYDVIHVGAAVPAHPEVLLTQLANGGRMFVPVGAEFGSQYIMMFDKNANGDIEERKLMGVRVSFHDLVRLNQANKILVVCAAY